MSATFRYQFSVFSFSLSAFICLLLASGLQADTLVLKNGQALSGKAFHREGEVIGVTTGPTGEPVAAGTPGTPLGEIAKVECDRPPVLAGVAPLLTAGKTSAALEKVQAALKSAEVYDLLPGSYWPDLLVLQADILLAMGRDDEAAKLATAMDKTKNPPLVLDALALRALMSARHGDHGTASLLAVEAKAATRPGSLAALSVVRGLACLEKKHYEEALKAFLELPVFLPDETAFGAIAQLGSAHAYFGMEDYDRAIAALEVLIKTQPETPQMAVAQTLLPEWQRRRTVVQEAKEP